METCKKILGVTVLAFLGLIIPLGIWLRPLPPRIPAVMQNIQKLSEGIAWTVEFDKRPTPEEVGPWQDFLRQQLNTSEEPTVRIRNKDVRIEFKKAIRETILIEAIVRLRTDDEQSDFSVITSPWQDGDELESITEAIRQTDKIPSFKRVYHSVVHHPHNPDNRYVLLSFAAEPATY